MAHDGEVVATENREEQTPRSEKKRKFDDTADNEEPVLGNTNGNSLDGGESGPAPVVSYNNVPPPLSEFEIAKQKAAQIAARLVGAEAKRPRTEETSAEDHSAPVRPNGLDLGETFADDNSKHNHEQPPEENSSFHQFQQHQEYQQHNPQQFHQPAHLDSQQYHQPPQHGSHQYYNQGGPHESRKIEVPNSKVGLVIGKGGETIKYLQHQSGARIQVARDGESDPRSSTRQVELMGTPEQISRAEQLVKDVIAEASTGAPGGAFGGRSFGGHGGEQVQIKVPNNKVGLIIGRGGETIKSLQSRSGARIQVQNDSETEPGATERVVTLIGIKKVTDMAYELIKEVIDENRTSRPPGGYNLQYGSGYRPSGPQQWGPPGAPPPYGYQQPAHYPGPPQPYPQAPPQAYGQFSQQPPGVYSSGWEQRSPASATQAQQQSSYDYYGQQNQQAHQPPQGATNPPNSAGYNQQSYYQGYQQQSAQAQTYGDPATTYSQQSYSQQAYVQPPYSGYSYAPPAQGDQQSYGQQGYPAYGQSQTGYTATSGETTAPPATSGYDYNSAAAGSVPAVPGSQPPAVSATQS
ncbi:uncharacterized protein [Physcomitrium patens]|uniref:K Homology domain-containing protein n=1 Tax=Physcomitrium patens TaxID=3218 RepID=A0A7I4A7M3_PHYPA|nr:far upstream element-binding protein 1-like isoform X2 [Physcomitrium patens]|eukprot:XP_024388756.1 far upstream element-binding protein 1-like isoform X2 [Physcomitrella patens]